MEFSEIRDFWVSAGNSFPENSAVTPTSRDPFLAALERRKIISFLRNDMDTLEVGCGDGTHTLGYSMHCRQIHGVDISSGLLDLARKRAANAGRSNIVFSCASVLDVSQLFPDRSFDCLLSQRCLINLPSWQLQMQAIEALTSCLKPGGLFLMTEGFNEPLRELNEARKRFELPEIRVVSYNRNFNSCEFEPYIKNCYDIEAVLDYGFYLLMSRLLHPLVVKPEMPRHDGSINEVSQLLDDMIPPGVFRKYSYNLLYVLRRK